MSRNEKELHVTALNALASSHIDRIAVSGIFLAAIGAVIRFALITTGNTRGISGEMATALIADMRNYLRIGIGTHFGIVITPVTHIFPSFHFYTLYQTVNMNKSNIRYFKSN